MNTMKERLRLFFDLVPEGELACNFGENDLLSFADAEAHLATIEQAARIAELEGALAKDSAELERLRSLVSHIRSLAPNGTRGLGSIMGDVFKAVEEFDKGATVVDQMDVELERLRKFVASVQRSVIRYGGGDFGIDNEIVLDAIDEYLDRAHAAQAELQAAPMPHVGDPWDCGGGR